MERVFLVTVIQKSYYFVIVPVDKIAPAVVLNLRTETDPLSEMCSFVNRQCLDKVQKPSTQMVVNFIMLLFLCDPLKTLSPVFCLNGY